MKDRVQKTGKWLRQRRGLHVLAWCLVFFVGGQLALSTVFDYLLPEYRFPWFYRLIECAERHPSSQMILCLGSSRFGTGLFAGEMTLMLRQATGDQNAEVFNASVPGGDYITSEKMLNELLARGLRPKLVLLEFCPDVLNHKMGWLNMHTTRTLCWHDLNDYGGDLANWQSLQRFALCRLFPLFQYRNGIRTRLHDRLLDDNTPQQLTDRHWTVELENAPLPAARQLSELASHFEQYHIGGQPVACLRRLLQRCEAEQIQVILIEPPVTEMHRKFYTAEIERQYHEFYQHLSEEFGLTRFSYRTAVPDGEFFDHHHCNRTGASRWSERVTEEVLIPGWGRLTGIIR